MPEIFVSLGAGKARTGYCPLGRAGLDLAMPLGLTLRAVKVCSMPFELTDEDFSMLRVWKIFPFSFTRARLALANCFILLVP